MSRPMTDPQTTIRDLAEQMARELGVPVSHAEVAIRNLIDKGFIELKLTK